MVAGKIKKLVDVGKKSKNVIKMTTEEIARRKRNLEKFKWNKKLSKKQQEKLIRQDKELDDMDKINQDQRLKDHDDAIKQIEKSSIEEEGWDQLYAKGGSVTKQRRLAKRGWGVTKRK